MDYYLVVLSDQPEVISLDDMVESDLPLSHILTDWEMAQEIKRAWEIAIPYLEFEVEYA